MHGHCYSEGRLAAGELPSRDATPCVTVCYLTSVDNPALGLAPRTSSRLVAIREGEFVGAFHTARSSGVVLAASGVDSARVAAAFRAALGHSF
jgi:hypothetical protein